MVMGDSGHQIVCRRPCSESALGRGEEETASAAERLRSPGRVLRRALLVVSDGVSYGLAARPRGGVAAVDAPLSLRRLRDWRQGSWELVRCGRHRGRSWLAGGPRWLRCAAIRCDAMLCYAARGAAPSPAEQPGLSRSQEGCAVE